MTLENIGGKTEEEIEDIVGVMADAGYGLTYDDAAGLIKKTREGPNPYDAAKSFSESALSVALSLETVVKSGSVELLNGINDSSTVDRGTDDQQNSSTSNKAGLIIRPNAVLNQLGFTISSQSSGYTTAYIIKDSTGEILYSKDVSGVSAGNSATFSSVKLLEGTKYRVVLGAGGASWTPGRTNTRDLSTQNSTGTTVDITGTTSYYPDGVYSVTGYSPAPYNSGSVALEWPQPADLYEWDVATFTATPDGETVNVYVAYNDGSGWTRTNSGNPISRNYSLADDSNISASDSVRIEAELSRSDTSNSPTLDSAYRSWVV